MKTLHRIPSLELQTAAFIQAARGSAVPCLARLHRNGFRVCLEYVPNLEVPGIGRVAHALAISDVYVPMRYRGRGWFTQYWQLCQLLAGGMVFIDQAITPVLWDNLERHGFREVAPHVMVIGQ